MNRSIHRHKACCSLGIIVVVLGSFSVCLSALAQPATVPATAPYVVGLESVNWGPPGGGNGSPLGVRTAQQGVDPATGGITYYAMFPAGSHFDLHWHSYDEFVVVVSGAVTLELGTTTQLVKTGSYIVIPARMPHSWDVPVGEDVVILVRRAGPADFNYVK